MSKLLILGVSPLPFEITDRSFGPGTRTWQIAEPLLEDGHDIHLIGMRIPSTYPADAPDEIVHVDRGLTYLSITDHLYFNTPYVPNHCCEYAPDAVIFAHGSASYGQSLVPPEVPVWIDLCGHVMAEAQAKAAVYDDDSYLAYFMDRVMGALLRGDRFSAVSNAQRYALIGELGLAGRLNARTNGLDLVHPIPCGVEHSDYCHERNVLREVELPREAFVVLWSGGFNTWTDIDTMFDGLVWAMDRHDALHFVATGGEIDGHDERTYPRFKEMIHGSAHAERFHLKGWLPRNLVPNYYFEADVGINCEKDIYEVRLGSKHRILDWSRAALPVVTTRVTELSQTIEREGVGFVTAPGDGEALGRALLEASARRVELPEIGQRFRQAMRRVYGFRETTVALRQWAERPELAPDHDAPRICLGALLGEDGAQTAEPAPADPSTCACPQGFVDLTEDRPRKPSTRRDPISQVRMLGPDLAYRDASEERVLAILEQTTDRSTGSDELAAHITDWPSRYHLSPQRANLVRPLAVEAGMRVLEIGAGTGAISRHLAECGAEVVALEGSLDRARAAALRLGGMDRVEVVCGTLDRFEDDAGFDLVVAVGVLEYAAATGGGSSTPRAFLERASQLVRKDGALIVAIENQIGLKYLLGYSEDHLDEAWVGIEDYPGDSGIRTFTRRRLQGLLADVELDHQRWLFPWPDYKLPRVIVSEQAYAGALSAEAIDRLIGTPVRDHAQARHRFCDDRRAHRVLLDEGLGPDVANSFLVVAGRSDGAIERLAPSGAVAWHFGEGRRRVWARHQEITRTDDGLGVRAAATHAPRAPRSLWWLGQHPAKEQPFFTGESLEQLFLDACHRSDTGAAQSVLERWRAELEAVETDRPQGLGPAHPFLALGAKRLLPPRHLDVILSNFVLDGDRLAFIDDEWEVAHGVDADLVMARALWYLAHTLVTSGNANPWGDDVTVDQLAATLGALCGLDISRSLLDVLHHAEAAFQALVFGGDEGELEDQHRRLGGLSRRSPEVLRVLPHSLLERRLDRHEETVAALRQWDENLRKGLLALNREMRALTAERDRLFAERDALISQREHATRERQQLAAERDGLAAERDGLAARCDNAAAREAQAVAENQDLAERLAATEARLDTQLQWRQGFDRRLLVRLYHRLRGPRSWDVG